MKNKIFHAICFGFIIGVLIRSLLYLDIYFIFLLLGLGFAVFAFFGAVAQKRNAASLIFSIFILSLAFGMIRFAVADVPNPAGLETKVGEKIELEGKIIDEPSLKENSQQAVAETTLPAKARILLSTGLEDDFEYGDIIRFTGVLEKPENFTTDQGKEFDYINYLRKDGILYLMYYPKIEIISSGNGNFLKAPLFKFKENFLNKINAVIPPPESLLLGGLIVGEKSAFPDELRQEFVDTGTIHIVALSGYNVTIVAEWFTRLFSFLPLLWAIWSGILAIILFVILTGASSTSVRAGIMSILALFARITGRNYDAGRGLLLAGISMIFINPFLLVFDISFQLSFIATIAVIFFSPKVQEHFLWVTKRLGLRDMISVTVAAYIFVSPFVLYQMGNFSTVALPANILILPFIPLTMGLGFLTGLAGTLIPILSIPFGFISYLFLGYELGIINFFSELPFASFVLSEFPWLVALLIYAYFMYKLFGKNIKKFFDFTPELS